MNRILLMGPPGAGKGTQGTLLADALGVPHITTGGMFRDEISRGSALGLEVAGTLQSGGFVDDALTTALLRSRLEQGDAAEGFVLDGYPRTVPQVGALDGLLGESGEEVDAAILLEVADEVLLARLTARSDGRADDGPDVIRERIARYHELTAPVALRYEERGLLRRINGAFPAELVLAAVLAAARAVHHPLVTHGSPLR